MIEKLISKHPNVKDQSRAKEIVTDYVNQVCVEILKNTAVFKNDNAGKAALGRFLATVNVL